MHDVPRPQTTLHTGVVTLQGSTELDPAPDDVAAFNCWWSVGTFVGMSLFFFSLVALAVVATVLWMAPSRHHFGVGAGKLAQEERRGDATPSRVAVVIFGSIAKVCARYPVAVILSAVAVTALCSIGITQIYIETDPVKLWVRFDVMWCAVLCCAVLCCAVLCCDVLCCAVL